MNVDQASINTVILAVFGIGGSVLIFRYIGPILSTQEKHRISQDKEIADLRTEVSSQNTKMEMLQEMVTQRAGVDDMRQYLKVSVDDNSSRQREAVTVMDRHGRDSADQHQQQILVMREMVATLRGIEFRLGGPDRRDENVQKIATQRTEDREDARDARADKREDRRDDREDRRDARENI